MNIIPGRNADFFFLSRVNKETDVHFHKPSMHMYVDRTERHIDVIFVLLQVPLDFILCTGSSSSAPPLVISSCAIGPLAQPHGPSPHRYSRRLSEGQDLVASFFDVL